MLDEDDILDRLTVDKTIVLCFLGLVQRPVSSAFECVRKHILPFVNENTA